jgi:hypothetical protein
MAIAAAKHSKAAEEEATQPMAFPYPPPAQSPFAVRARNNGHKPRLSNSKRFNGRLGLPAARDNRVDPGSQGTHFGR